MVVRTELQKEGAQRARGRGRRRGITARQNLKPMTLAQSEPQFQAPGPERHDGSEAREFPDPSDILLEVTHLFPFQFSREHPSRAPAKELPVFEQREERRTRFGNVAGKSRRESLEDDDRLRDLASPGEGGEKKEKRQTSPHRGQSTTASRAWSPDPGDGSLPQ